VSTESQEIAAIISRPEEVDGGPVSCGPGAVFAERVAQALIAAGCRKLAMATTTEDLDVLPVGSVVLVPGGVAYTKSNSEEGMWFGLCARITVEYTNTRHLGLPALVLHEGTRP
jgi:hypothetical protein